MSDEISEKEIYKLLSRSYALRLIEDYVNRFDSVIVERIPFQTLVDRQSAFDHIIEVLKQDLRLGEKTNASEYCKNDPILAVKRFIVNLLLEKHTNNDLNIKDNLCLKGMFINDLKSF